ncbi:MAG: replicative DNA helicase [Paludibacteraceae bacterium]|nr:replicative DNA helicase [Paludibacteraceae bacterium]
MDSEKQDKKFSKNSKPTVTGVHGKVPPQALEIEEAVLGALMLEKDAFSMVSDFLHPEDFYKPQHVKIFKAICDLENHSQPIDMHTVTEQLRKNGDLAEIGNPYYIANLTANVASTAHLEYHARIIVQKSLARELIKISSEIETQAFEQETDIDELLQKAEEKIFAISQQNLKKDAQQINPIVTEAIKRIEIARNAEGSISGVASGYKLLDNITYGFQPSDLIIIAARPAMGKTAFVLSMAKNMAVDGIYDGKGVNKRFKVALFSLEMSNIQLVNRLLMNVCEIEGDKIKTGKLEDNEWDLLNQNLKKLDGAPIFLDDTPSLSIAELRSKARRLKSNEDIDIIIIDYLQLMSGGDSKSGKFGSREQEVSTISRSLKSLAKELNIPIIALSQLNRGVENRTGTDAKRPQLSDLRESGAIEQDADMVCFIHRPEYYKIFEDSNGNDLRGIGEIIVAKHRNGAVGDVHLRFRPSYALFENLTEESIQYVEVSSSINKEHPFNTESSLKVPVANTDDSVPF